MAGLAGGTAPGNHIDESEIHLWSVRIAAVKRRWPDWSDVLARDESDRMERYRRTEDRERFGVTRALVRRLLGERTGVSPRQVEFAYNRFSKPSVLRRSGRPLRFSVSHAGEFAVVALAWDRPLGVDWEEIRTGADFSSLVSAVCNEREKREIESLPPPDRVPELFRYWTLKEAYVKALGVGLSFPHRRVDIRRNERPVDGVRCHLDIRGRWSVFSLNDVAGYAGAVVVWGAPVTLRRHSAEWI